MKSRNRQRSRKRYSRRCWSSLQCVAPGGSSQKPPPRPSPTRRATCRCPRRCCRRRCCPRRCCRRCPRRCVSSMPHTRLSLSSLPQTMLSSSRLPQTILSSLPQTMLSFVAPDDLSSPRRCVVPCPRRCCRQSRHATTRCRRPSGTGAPARSAAARSDRRRRCAGPRGSLAVGIDIGGGDAMADPVLAAAHAGIDRIGERQRAGNVQRAGALRQHVGQRHQPRGELQRQL